MALSEETPIYGIITVLVILIVAGGTFLLYSKYIKPEIDKLGYDKLPSGMKTQFNTRWDKLIENVKNCTSIIDYDCTCDGFPNFPATFSGDFKINIENRKISLLYGTASLNDTQVTDAQNKVSYLGYAYISRITRVGPITRSEDFLEKGGYIDFGKIENFNGVDYPTLNYGSNSDIIFSNKFYKTDPNSANFLIPSSSDSKYRIEEQKIIDNQPACLQYRTSEIKRFEDFVKFANSNSNEPYPIILEDGYTIFVGTIQSTYYAFLKYQGQDVFNYNWESKKSESIKTTVPMPPCTEPQPLTFFNGNIAQISSKDGKPCLKRP
jgi:hypothetical protein